MDKCFSLKKASMSQLINLILRHLERLLAHIGLNRVRRRKSITEMEDTILVGFEIHFTFFICNTFSTGNPPTISIWAL